MKNLLPVFLALLLLSSCKDKEVAVESVTIDKGATAEIHLGETLQLKATVLPDNAASKEVSWNSSKPEIATVSGGLVTPVIEGETIISAAAGGKTANCTVTVLSKSIPLTALSFNPDKVTLTIKEKKILVPDFTPADASDKTLEWSSDNNAVAAVSQGGEVEAKGAGTCKITAKSVKFPAVAAVCEVTVFVPLTGISFNPVRVAIVSKEKKPLVPIFNPPDASDKTVEWSSDNSDIAVVNGVGEVEAKKTGTCKITVKSAKSPTIAATCEIVVVPAPVVLTGLKVFPSDTTVEAGTSFQLRHKTEPADATVNTEVIRLSSDATRATVSETGRVTVLAITSTPSPPLTITVKSKGNPSISATCTLTIVAAAVRVASITITPDAPKIPAGQKLLLTATVFPSEATNKTVIWRSSDESKATVRAVSSGGEVTAGTTPGQVSITATATDGSKITGTANVTVIPLATAISINPSNPAVGIGKTLTLTVSVTPENASKAVTWGSSNTSAATIDATTGVVTGQDIGETTITAKATDGSGLEAATRVTVTPATTAIAINPSNPLVGIGKTRTLTVSVTPENASKTVTWKSSDPSKATIDAAGLLTGIDKGTTVITAATTDGSGLEATTTVTVAPVATAITINPAEPVVGVNKTITLTVSVTPENAGKAVTWESSDHSKATIDAAGVVTGVEIGETVITAKATDGSDVSTTKKVTVKSSDASLTAMTLGATNHAVTPVEGGTAYLNNAPRSFTITAVRVTFTAAEGATVKIGTTTFTSGGNVDFTNPVSFIVTAADGATTKTYTVDIPAYDAATNPYGIYMAAQLSDVRKALDKSYKLMNDIALPDLSAEAATDLAISDYATKGWKPLGDRTTAYTGTFDGNKHSITNLRINRSDEDYVALFGITGGTGTIKNLGVASAGISGKQWVAAIVGGTSGGTLVTHCSSTGTITGATNNAIGGLVGLHGKDLNGSGQVISNCFSSCVVTAMHWDPTAPSVGALVGGSKRGIVTNCYATGTASITGTVRPGGRPGLVGDNSWSGNISTCYATGGNGLTFNIEFETDGKTIWQQGTVTNSYYPVGKLGNSSGGSEIPVRATQADFVGFDFDNVWTWEDGKWPKLRNVPGTQPDVDLPR